MDTSNITNLLENIYKKVGYFDIYGGSLISSVFILLVFFLLLSYFYIMSNIKPIKNDWARQRCSPSVIPFAGLINKPPNMTAFEFTGANFSNCLNNILTDITGDFFQPIYYMVNALTTIIKGITESVQAIRKKIMSVVGNIVSIDNEIMGRIMGVLSPLRLMLIKIKDSLSKVTGIGVTSIYSVIGLWLSIQTFVRIFIKMMIDGLLYMLAAIILLWILPFTWELAATMTVIFGSMAAILGVVIDGTQDIVNDSSSVPKKPMCFDENTFIQMENGSYLQIKNINVNMKLFDGGIVTSIFKVSQNKMDMYNYNDVIVSGNHNILLDNNWISVRDIPHIISIADYDKEFLYCLNTTTKKIIINDVVFSDWDDIEEHELIHLRKVIHEKYGIQIHYSNIHKYLEGGFQGETQIEMENGKFKNMCDLQPNDILNSGNIVKGIVKISSTDIKLYKYKIDNIKFYGTYNNIVKDNDLGSFSTMDVPFIEINHKPEYLYHIITESGLIWINGVIFADYNGCLEHFLP